MPYRREVIRQLRLGKTCDRFRSAHPTVLSQKSVFFTRTACFGNNSCLRVVNSGDLEASEATEETVSPDPIDTCWNPSSNVVPNVTNMLAARIDHFIASNGPGE